MEPTASEEVHTAIKYDLKTDGGQWIGTGSIIPLAKNVLPVVNFKIFD